ncbi:hypothetical protein AB0J74_30215 [Asanoa sp. NPDC049573]|uniref:hypothetical protein n=1 Tax=Asanoa sp. NPDC049573 TaxID=3155396 RepID=UPI003423ADA7
MSRRAPALGVYVVDTVQLHQINEQAHRNAWGGAWSSGAALSSVVDEHGKHVIVPMATASRADGDDECFRCWLWYLVRGQNERRCTLVDVGERMLASLPKMDAQALEGLVPMLLSQLPLTAIH